MAPSVEGTGTKLVHATVEGRKLLRWAWAR